MIYHKGRWLIEPEIKALLTKLEAENAELRAKVESDNRQIAEYKRLLKAAVEDFSNIYDHILDCDRMCDICPLNGERDHCFKWRHADEALALIGDESNGI